MSEPGSSALDHLFNQANSGHLTLTFSAWNIGEALGALDEHHQRRDLTDSEHATALSNFLDEILHMTRSGSARIIPVSGKLLATSWHILRRAHIYQADALQIATCKEEGCNVLLAEDRRLLEASRKEGLNSRDPAKDEKYLLSL